MQPTDKEYRVEDILEEVQRRRERRAEPGSEPAPASDTESAEAARRRRRELELTTTLRPAPQADARRGDRHAFRPVSAVRPVTPPAGISTRPAAVPPRVDTAAKTENAPPASPAGVSASEKTGALERTRVIVAPPAGAAPTIPVPSRPPVSEKAAASAAEQEDGGDDVKVYVPKTRSMSGKGDTKLIPAPSDKPMGSFTVTQAPADGDELDQIQLDSLVEPEIADSAEDEDWEERLEKERRKKAESFQLHGLKLTGEEEEDNDPSEEPDLFEDGELEDYGSYEETDAVRHELVYRRRTGWIQLILTGILTLILTVASAGTWFHLPAASGVIAVTVNLFLLVVVALINHRTVGSGIAALFRMHATMESAAAATTLAVILHTAAQYGNLAAIQTGRAVLLTPVAALGLFLAALGRQMLFLRVGNNFQFVSWQGQKYAVRLIEDSRDATEIGRSAVALGEPVVSYVQKTGFLTGFLRNSYEEDAGDRTMRRYMPIAVGASLVLAAIYAAAKGISFPHLMEALTVFASSVCLSAPLAVMTAVHFPMLRAAKRALRHGAMLVGGRAVDEFGEVHALAVDALDLFPSESVLLHGIKTFSGTRIDEAILDAAAVSIAAGGPLSSVFRRVIQEREEILQEVDTLVYEQDMGMSGWVGGRRVLIGNRRLLENHGVDVPSRDYEARYTKDRRQIVYLSTAGELSAMFVVSYVADESIADSLAALTDAGVTLLVRTCDPNVTEELICEVFDLDPYYVEVLSASAGRRFEQLASETAEESEAVLASNGRLDGVATAVTCCRRLHGASRIAVAVQVIGGALGLALSAFLWLYTGITLPPIMLMAYSLIWMIFSWIFPLIRRI